MRTQSSLSPWSRRIPALALGLVLSACGTPPERTSPAETPGVWAGRSLGARPAPNPGVRRGMVARAIGEWEYFNRQLVVLKGNDESIPHVGAWEDDDPSYAARVNVYWRAVGKSNLDGMDCRQPWSAAFLSWIMQNAGVPEGQFPRATAHWSYLGSMIEEAAYPGRWFVPRRVADYSPNPGDLICAPRGFSRPPTFDGYVSPAMLRSASLHCDLVVGKSGGTLEAIGGNVRNSVSKTIVELDAQGRLRPVPRRPWFLIMENRL